MPRLNLKISPTFSPADILCVHQGYELYGSDRTFISSLLAIREKYPDANISVILPRDGDLSLHLKKLGFLVTIQQLWVLRKANGVLGNIGRLLALPFSVIRTVLRLRGYALVYINTSVIFDYSLASRFSSSKAILHIHEIPTGMAMSVIRAVASFATANVVYNSIATKQAFNFSARGQHVLHNGIPHRPAATPRQPRSEQAAILRILMIGRINGWKGQDLLLQAIVALPASQRSRLIVKFAGAAFEDGPDANQLAAEIVRVELTDQVSMEGFVEDPSDLYQWADVVVVPSKKPEPFGLVAVEAMAQGRPVIAADHGGLQEIVLHEKTGLLFEPGNAVALANALQTALDDPDKMDLFGRLGHDRYVEHFTEERYKANFQNIIERVLKDQPAIN